MNTWSRLVFEEETIGIPGVHSLGQYNYVAARAGLPPHKHDGCVEISLLVKGYQTYQVGGRTYHVKGGEQYISLPNEMHDTGSEPQDKGILYWIILDVTRERSKFLFLAPGMARTLIADLLQFPSRHFAAPAGGHETLDLAFRALRSIRKPDECTGIFQKSSREAYLEPKHRKSGRGPMDASFYLLEAASHIVYYILQTIAASRMSVRPMLPVIQESLEFIAQNEESWLSVAKVAEKAKLSESYFKILFREQVGLPPAEYMLRRKIESAKTLLSEPNCNITELAYRLGFSSSQYFATVFRRFTNQTPSEFIAGQAGELIKIIDGDD
jgi:AraC-like DNA-binding protein/quercetin dioxygenase-like cupin family protein